MAVTPSTDLTLLKLPIELDDENQLTFASASDQATYFQSLTKLTEDKFTYQRRESAIRFPAHIDSIIEYNYVMYKNSNYSNKWFYARIVNMEYINDGMTLITIEEDSFQTWQFDIVYNQCFVEREHVNDDTIGAHTILENLELGDTVQNLSYNFEPNRDVWTSGHTAQLTNKYMIVFQVSELPTGSYGISNPHRYNGVYSGLFFFGVTTPADATAMIYKYASETKTDAIVSIFLAPTSFFDDAQFSNIMTSYGNVTVYYPVEGSSASSMCDNAYTVSRPSTLNGYTPKNKKMFTYPFSYLLVDNNAGTCITQRYENFGTSSTPSYWMAGALGQGCSIKLMPIDYKGSGTNAENYGEAINATKLPICGWASDYYTNWLTQNAVNIPLTFATTAGAVGLAIATGGTGLAVTGAAMLSAGTQIGNLLSQQYQASLVPDQAKGNSNASDMNIAYQRFFTVKCMSIKYEYAKMIDDYLSAYGYRVNAIKTPNITGRTNWNYVKTVGSSLHGYFPQQSVDKINQMFDKGITLWHNPSTFMDYSQSNAIVTP